MIGSLLSRVRFDRVAELPMPEQCRKCVPRIEKEHQALAKAEQSATAAATAATIPESAQADSVAQQHTGAELEEIWMGRGWKGSNWIEH